MDTICNGCEEKSTPGKPVREPCKVRVGTMDTGEHGLGADYPIGRVSPGAPVKAPMRQKAFCKSRWYRVSFVALGIKPMGDFLN